MKYAVSEIQKPEKLVHICLEAAENGGSQQVSMMGWGGIVLSMLTPPLPQQNHTPMESRGPAKPSSVLQAQDLAHR